MLLTACGAGDGLGQDRLSAGWPQWQKIEGSPPPVGWRVEEVSLAFDAWEARAVVAELATATGATLMRFEDGDGRSLEVRVPALPSRPLSPAITRGDSVHISLVHRQGFEGVAQGLVVRDTAGDLLFLYDDGGYGPAFYEDGARAGMSVSRSLRGPSSGNDWESPAVIFRLDGESVVCVEGESARLGQLAVKVIVSREWTGEPVTDADLSPLAYMIYRPR